jgi:transcription termination factor Rho
LFLIIDRMRQLYLNRVWILRKLLQPLNAIDGMEFLLDKFMKTETNEQFLASMNQ